MAVIFYIVGLHEVAWKWPVLYQAMCCPGVQVSAGVLHTPTKAAGRLV